ncbi:OLC1v1038782C1 [Oldenlandia corymbosa var. corymbosa]|uniref:OLC1v1038782C1 n=1 Tax=Oldenlandia corymbosa var. corymbosa TaxID=529605 RepID=A0AAV1D164_OLDCO|nr:OLC1v1038782C1 [Oldenlandia corymbosa var. corymbosa]
MRKGMRRGPGTAGGGGLLRKQLLRDIESCSNKYYTADELVSHLRSKYRTYERKNLRELTRLVDEILQETKNGKKLKHSSFNSDNCCGSGDDSSDNCTVQKKGKKRHIMDDMRNSVGSTVSTSDVEEFSTADDVVYGEEYEPKFDLMKSQLRERYCGERAGKENGRGAVELEVDKNTARKEVQKVVLLEESRNQDSSVARKDDGRRSDEGVGNGGPLFKDFGGMDKVLDDLIRNVIVPLFHPHLPQHLGVKPISGILLHGPPGCGKTKLAHAIANETGLPFYKISATELVSGISGESEENIRDLFAKAYKTAPSIVFIDEIDAIASKRENLQREMERRIVTQLMTCMDESHRPGKPADGDSDLVNSNARPGHVLVIGATNRPDAVDPALRRPGRFDREVSLGVPDENARIEILSVVARNLKVEGNLDLLKIARATPGFVGADLVALANMAGYLAMNRTSDLREAELSRSNANGEHCNHWWKQTWSLEEIEKSSITMADFEKAAGMVQPSSRREGFSAIPNVKWDDVGGLHHLRQELDRYIVRHIKFPEYYEDFGLDQEMGFLLYGPPGCGKTLIAKAVANEAGANFIHIKGPELLNKYLGESESRVRTIFQRARTCPPCILFFDEVDALTTNRGREGGRSADQVLNQLLIELDGADHRKGVYVIGATNRPEVMDNALLRPGRFGKLVYVPLPNAEERGLILKCLAKKKPIDTNVDLMAVGRDCCQNLSGADLSALMNEAAMAAMDDALVSDHNSSGGSTRRTIKYEHFKRALEKISPSVLDESGFSPLGEPEGVALRVCTVQEPEQNQGANKGWMGTLLKTYVGLVLTSTHPSPLIMHRRSKS